MDTVRCPICDSTDLDARPRPPGHPHHAKAACRRCERFVKWMPRPAGPIPDYCLDAARTRPGPAELVGTKAQVKWARAIRDWMLVRAERDGRPRLAMLIRAIADSTWFIANRDRDLDTLRWPAPDQLAPTPMEARP
jgi:hypothetical protein